mgnify:CR=1 FL=1
MEIFHERLKQGILSKNLSLSQFGRILGVSQQVISRWCSGMQIPNLSRFRQICEVLEMDANFLLGLDIKRGGALNKRLSLVKSEWGGVLCLAAFNHYGWTVADNLRCVYCLSIVLGQRVVHVACLLSHELAW